MKQQPSQVEDDNWLVQVYRYTSARGWEIFQDVIDPSSSNIDSKISVSPRKGCVEIQKLRLRIHLFSSRKPATTVIRRMDTILLSSRKSAGAIVLKFTNINECISFADRLIYLNNHDYMQMMVNNDQLSKTNKAENDKSIMINQLDNCHNSQQDSHHGSTKSTISKSVEDPSSTTQTEDHQDITTSVGSSGIGMDKKLEIHSYIARLLHDDDFMQFVSHVEEELTGSPDLAQILYAVGLNPQKNLPLMG